MWQCNTYYIGIEALAAAKSAEGRRSMEAILDGDVRRAPVTEQSLLNVPSSVSAGSKHDKVIILIHSNDQPPIVPYITAVNLVYYSSGATSTSMLSFQWKAGKRETTRQARLNAYVWHDETTQTRLNHKEPKVVTKSLSYLPTSSREVQRRNT